MRARDQTVLVKVKQNHKIPEWLRIKLSVIQDGIFVIDYQAWGQLNLKQHLKKLEIWQIIAFKLHAVEHKFESRFNRGQPISNIAYQIKNINFNKLKQLSLTSQLIETAESLTRLQAPCLKRLNLNHNLITNMQFLRKTIFSVNYLSYTTNLKKYALESSFINQINSTHIDLNAKLRNHYCLAKKQKKIYLFSVQIQRQRQINRHRQRRNLGIDTKQKIFPFVEQLTAEQPLTKQLQQQQNRRPNQIRRFL